FPLHSRGGVPAGPACAHLADARDGQADVKPARGGQADVQLGRLRVSSSGQRQLAGNEPDRPSGGLPALRLHQQTTAGDHVHGMTKTRRTAISSICAITASSQMKLKNVFSTTTFSLVIRGDLVISIF